MIEAVRGCLIGPKTWYRIVGIFGAILDSPQTIWAAWVVIYALNHVLVYMRPRMAMDFGFTKWNRGWTSGLPMDSPLLGFGTVKISLGLCELDKNRPCVVCLNC